MKIRLLDDRILVKPDEIEKKTASGIILPGAEKDVPKTGRIVVLGDDPEMNQKLKVGNRIIFPQFAGDEVTTTEGKFLLFKRDDVLAILED